PAGTLRYRLRELLGYPDNFSGWIVPAFRLASRLLRTNRFNAVITISPPVSAHLVGLMLHKRFCHIPWFAQFHDPWSTNPFHQRGIGFLTRLDRYFEARVVRKATRILCATE